MVSQASARLSAAQTGWVIALLMTGWALFLILPFGREDAAAAPKIPVERPGEAELAVAGLRYNVDFIGLPQYFAIWADRIEWMGNETEFAYWNPGTSSYSYVIRATRIGEKQYRFRHMRTEPAVNQASNAVPESETHPFIFPVAKAPALEESAGTQTESPILRPAVETPRANVRLEPAPLAAPKKLETESPIHGTKP